MVVSISHYRGVVGISVGGSCRSVDMVTRARGEGGAGFVQWGVPPGRDVRSRSGSCWHGEVNWLSSQRGSVRELKCCGQRAGTVSGFSTRGGLSREGAVGIFPNWFE